MPRYYCDYCDTYLTHDSPSVRKQHNAGYKHKANVRNYYQQFEAQLNQSLIDQKVKEHLVAYRPIGPPYNPLRPGIPVLPTPQMPMPIHGPIPGQGGTPLPGTTPLMPGMRPPVLARPPGAPGFGMPPMVAPPNAPLPGQLNSLPRPLGPPPMVPGSAGMPPPMVPGSAGMPPPMVPGSAGMPPSSGAPPSFTPVYQGNMAAPPPGSDDSTDPNAHATEANH